jgi:prepilin signal peptidase PulO-like enzyme (type II secretory pathway)
MNIIESIPFELRLALLFVIGTFLGSLANWATYQLAWNPRPIGPWTKPHRYAPPRAFTDRIPIFGWLGLRRESGLHGVTFWIRPLLVELFTGFGLAWLYWWEVSQAALFPPGVFRPIPEAWLGLIHIHFVVHTVFLWLMIVATLIDADEKTIPDMITVPGTLFALLMAATFPNSLLPVVTIMPDLPKSGTFLTLASPKDMPQFLLAGQTAALVIGLGCWWLWCVGLMRRDWYPRHGVCRALVISWKRLKRTPSTYYLLVLGLIGTVGIFLVWNMTFVAGGNRVWVALITVLIGMAAAGGLVWMIRLIGAAVLKREAMGFGDVTLMAMIGAFLGWQPSIITFFFAPMIAVLIGLGMWFLRRENEIPFGPFLCISATIVLLNWSKIWDWAGPRFELGMFIPIIIAVCLVLMAVMLGVLQVIKRFLRARSAK